MRPFTTLLNSSQAIQLEEALHQQGFSFQHPAHTKFSAQKEGLSCTLYLSGKLLVQGRRSLEWIETFLEPAILGEVKLAFNAAWHSDFKVHLGSDESGKGDLFGPLCVACVKVHDEHLTWLHHIGVRDSKEVADHEVRTLAREIWQRCPCQIEVLSPQEYNLAWSHQRNLNKLLAALHSKAIKKLYLQSKEPSALYVLVDKFASYSGIQHLLETEGVYLPVQERPRAEADPAVAAASLLARAAFLKGLHELGVAIGRTLPKGAGAPAKKVLLELLKDQKTDQLPHVAKMHFKTIGYALNEIETLC